MGRTRRGRMRPAPLVIVLGSSKLPEDPDASEKLDAGQHQWGGVRRRDRPHQRQGAEGDERAGEPDDRVRLAKPGLGRSAQEGDNEGRQADAAATAPSTGSGILSHGTVNTNTHSRRRVVLRIEGSRRLNVNSHAAAPAAGEHAARACERSDCHEVAESSGAVG